MRKFGVQKFLNHANSSGHGWVKFNINPSPPEDNWKGFECDFIISDCDHKVNLEFEPQGVWKNKDGKYNRNGAMKARLSIARRRKKWETFVKAVLAFDKAYTASLDEYESQLEEILEGDQLNA